MLDLKNAFVPPNKMFQKYKKTFYFEMKYYDNSYKKDMCSSVLLVYFFRLKIRENTLCIIRK